MVARNPEDPWPSYVRERVEQVVAQTGYTVVIQEEVHLEFDSVVRFASPLSPRHEISYSPAYRAFASHFVLSSLEKIRRYFAAPVVDRYVPSLVGSGYLPADEELELERRLIRVSPHVVAAVSRQLQSGLVRQLTSFPLDARVELDLFATVPEHREQQLAYLRRQLMDLEPHFSLKIAALSPPRTYAASSAMNCAFAELCSRLTGERPSRRAEESPHRLQGLDLVALLDAVNEPSHAGDRKVTDAWARALGLGEFYEWVSMDA